MTRPEEPAFAIRAWESQLEWRWCRTDDAPDWLRNTRYVNYLYEVLDRAPDYDINTLMLEVDGIVLVFSETLIDGVTGSPCRCEACRSHTGRDFLHRIVRLASDVCRRLGKQLVVRTSGRVLRLEPDRLCGERAATPRLTATQQHKEGCSIESWQVLAHKATGPAPVLTPIVH